MFNLLQKFNFSPAQTIAAKPEVSMPVIRVPQNFSEPQPPASAEATKSYGCLDDVFGELLDEQVSYALSKW